MKNEEFATAFVCIRPKVSNNWTQVCLMFGQRAIKHCELRIMNYKIALPLQQKTNYE